MADGAQFRPPPKLGINDPNLADSFTKWKCELEVDLAASEKNRKPNIIQVAIILNCAGPQFIAV